VKKLGKIIFNIVAGIVAVLSVALVVIIITSVRW
jgi:hypothetical protein